ncbi:hypothetical protein [Nocardia thailandica]|uniref:hypothetical protein n=1 Tax=Nocardia thailandica TaxID=257275 RepID=UPI0002E71033|nr:hypothetical protein [Nocardia thailandica]
MSIVTSRTRVETHHEWVVPLDDSGKVPVGDFLEAIAFARSGYAAHHGSIPTLDDWAHVTHEDDRLVVFFTTSEVK